MSCRHVGCRQVELSALVVPLRSAAKRPDRGVETFDLRGGAMARMEKKEMHVLYIIIIRDRKAMYCIIT